jgi:hypothetical protein
LIVVKEDTVDRGERFISVFPASAAACWHVATGYDKLTASHVAFIESECALAHELRP